MNDLLHNVNQFIDKHEVIKNFYLFCGYILNDAINDGEAIAKCFMNHPVEFTRLYESLTDILFNIEDEEITHFVEESFNEERIEERKMNGKAMEAIFKKCGEITRENYDTFSTWGPLMLLLFLSRFSHFCQTIDNKEIDNKENPA